MLSGPGERENTLVAPTYTDLAGKAAVVTGGSGGIGAATCRMLAANGMKVVVNGRDEAKIGAVVDAIRSADGEAIGVAADCTDFAAVERMRKQAEEELGPIGVVAAFAGGGRARPGPVEQTTEEEWRSTVDANLTATFLTLKSFLPGMIERGGGSFVTMASSAARFPTGAPAPYAAAKAGVIMLTRQVANEAGNHGVRVNCLAPQRCSSSACGGSCPRSSRGGLRRRYPKTVGDSRGRGAGHPFSRLRELLLDHGCNARCSGG